MASLNAGLQAFAILASPLWSVAVGVPILSVLILYFVTSAVSGFRQVTADGHISDPVQSRLDLSCYRLDHGSNLGPYLQFCPSCCCAGLHYWHDSVAMLLSHGHQLPSPASRLSPTAVVGIPLPKTPCRPFATQLDTLICWSSMFG